MKWKMIKWIIPMILHMAFFAVILLPLGITLTVIQPIYDAALKLGHRSKKYLYNKIYGTD